MDWIVVAVLVVGLPIALGVWLVVRTVQSGKRLEELSSRLLNLEIELSQFKRSQEPARKPEAAPLPVASPEPSAVDQLLQKQREAATSRPPEPPPAQQSQPLEIPFAAPQAPLLARATAAEPPTPPPIILPATPPIAPAPKEPSSFDSFADNVAQGKINWEQFMGVKLFAWIGGLALFLGVVFFVKYAFDHNLVPPELRVALGFLTGLGLVVGGTMLHRNPRYTIGAQTLCATGVVILYATTFAARAFYHFLAWPGAWWDALPAFALMALITTTGFLLAVRLNALVVAILGMLGGFLTPVLLSTGQDHPFGLFGYIALLDIGLIAVALHRRWLFLAALAAAGTVLMQIAWAGEFFTQGKYFEDNKVLIPMGVLFVFNALYVAATGWAKRREQRNWWLAAGALGIAAAALAFAGYFLSFMPLAQRPWLVLGFVFVIDFAVLALVLLDGKLAAAQPLAGLAVFVLLVMWTDNALNNQLLPAALAFYLLFAIVHSVGPMLLRRVSGATAPPWWSQAFPPLALVLVLIPIFQLADVSLIIWPFVLLVDVLAIGLAVLTASLLPVLVVLLLTLAATGVLILKIPDTLTGLPTSLFVLGAFALFFVAVGVWLARKFKAGPPGNELKFIGDLSLPADFAALLPALSAILPFQLLIMATLRLPLADPSPVFGLALLFVVLLLGVTKLFALDWLPAVGLACVVALECAWHFNRFDPANAAVPLIWYLGFFAVFAVFPFLFLRQWADKIVPWAAAAMAGPPQFFLVHRLVKAAYPNEYMGLLPAAFALPALLSLVVVLKKIFAAGPARTTRLAWFGGVALFFITLIFPIQFDRQWITIGWALEGAALLWLFHRVPHDGLRLTGIGLLMASFVRLALNRAVLDYHARSATPILNWYLYAYGIVTVCLFVGARLLAPPRNLIGRDNVPPILNGIGTVLAFLLLNIEIADYFSAPGTTLTFQFSGDFGRDMTYSIAWALFALVLLVAGIVRKLRPPRYAALGLLSVTLLKLFFHDLARLDQLYRIGAFVGVAVIAILSSFSYQRFFSSSLDQKDTSNAPPT